MYYHPPIWLWSWLISWWSDFVWHYVHYGQRLNAPSLSSIYDWNRYPILTITFVRLIMTLAIYSNNPDAIVSTIHSTLILDELDEYAAMLQYRTIQCKMFACTQLFYWLLLHKCISSHVNHGRFCDWIQCDIYIHIYWLGLTTACSN